MSAAGLAEDDGDEFLAAACEAVRRSSGPAALDALGWWDLVDELDDPDARAAVFTLFRAQGRQLGDSGAFAGLLARPYLAASDPAHAYGAGSVSAVVTRRSLRRGPVMVLVGDLPSVALLVDRPGAGVWLVPTDEVELRPVEIPGRLTLHEVAWSPGTVGGTARRASEPTIPESAAEPARRRSHFLGRVALACEMLGAAEATLALAVDHVGAREQFGQPIGKFQAVRHLLAWARTDCAAIEAVARQAVALDRSAPAGFDEVLKALAGRNARRTCERTLQTLGGIGFTAEHTHHHFHSRILALDSLLGTSAQLSRDLGARLRTERTEPQIAASLLLPAMPR